MIVVKVELHSANSGRVTILGQMHIANDETGTASRGNYVVQVLRRRKGSLWPVFWTKDKKEVTRVGKVEDYPRNSYNVWRLVIRALLSAFPEEQRVTSNDR